MYLIVAQVIGTGATASVGRLGSILEVSKDPGDGLEHVYAQAMDGGALLAMFFVAPGLDTAERTARKLCTRALTTAPGLDGCVLGQLLGVEGIL
ncbi:hypothetical protein [Streptomyces sp. NPDC127038]|uniref:hypothetical protein n=1 Tax=Streptomyces sp. NPDC127038 TaxID=3347114 RepID=UPI00365447A5